MSPIRESSLWTASHSPPRRTSWRTTPSHVGLDRRSTTAPPLISEPARHRRSRRPARNWSRRRTTVSSARRGPGQEQRQTRRGGPGFRTSLGSRPSPAKGRHRERDVSSRRPRSRPRCHSCPPVPGTPPERGQGRRQRDWLGIPTKRRVGYRPRRASARPVPPSRQDTSAPPLEGPGRVRESLRGIQVRAPYLQGANVELVPAVEPPR